MEQVAGQWRGLREGDQVTAGQHIRVDSQPFPRYPLLEGGREEAIVSAHRDPDRHVRPAGKSQTT